MQNAKENVKCYGSTRVISHRQKSHKQRRIPEQTIKTLEPILIESSPDSKSSQFLNTEEEETKKTQEEIEWEIYEAGWDEGYQSGISAQAKAKTKKKKSP